MVKIKGLEFNIILEGCDGVGKSTIYDYIMHRGLLGERMIGLKLHNKMPPKSFEEGKQLNEEFLNLSNKFHGVVFDRHIFSEYIYAPILRNYTPEYVFEMETNLQDHNILFLLDASIHTVKKRFDGQVITYDLIPEILYKYFIHFLECNYPYRFLIDTTYHSPIQVVNLIECYLQNLRRNNK